MPGSDPARYTTTLLHHAADPFRLLVESIKDYAIYLLDPEGRIVSWNTGAERIKGYAAAEALGQPFDLMYAPGDAAAGKPRRDLDAALARGRHEEEGPRPRNGGSTYWGLKTITPLSEGDRHVGFAVLIRDASEWKRREDQLRANEERLALALDAGRLGMWEWDLRTGLVHWDRTECELLGVTPGGPLTPEDFFRHVHPDDLAGVRAAAAGALRDDAAYAHEFRVVRGDGEVRWLVGRGRVVRDGATGEPVRMLGVNYDITERKRAEQRLAASEARFRALVENSFDGVILAGERGEILYASPAAYRIAGLTEGDLHGRAGFDFVHPDDAPAVRGLFERALGTPATPFTGRNRVRHRDGSYRWVEFTLTNHLGDPSLRAMVANFRDVTEVAEADELRHKSEEATSKLLAVVESTQDAILGEDRDGTIVSWNPGAERLYGYRAGEVIGRNIGLLVPPACGEESRALKERVWRGERVPPFETVRLRSDGSPVEVEVSMSPVRDRDGRVVAISKIAHDISGRKQAERELAHSRRMLEQIVGTTPDLVYVYDLVEGRNTFVNASSKKILGYSPEQIAAFGPALGETLIHPDDLPGVVEGNARFDTLGEGEVYDHEFRMRHADGHYRWLRCRDTVFERDAAGKATKIVGTAQDVTDRKRAEYELLLRDRAIRAVASGILITDPHQPDNPIIFASPGLERLTGYAPGEVVGRNCRFLQGRDTDPKAVAEIRAAVRAGRACDVELLNYRKDGTPFWNHLSVSPVHDRAGRLTHFIGVQTDATGRKELEAQFRQAQKMEAVGRLAGGVAHDFNNLLTIINGYTEVLMRQLPAGDPVRDMVAEVHKAGERAGSLTKQLLVFSRQSVLESKVVDLNGVVADTEKMLRRLIGEDVRLTTALAPGLGAVRTDPGQLQQALINLAVNARDAMPRGGTLTVETRAAELTPEQAGGTPGCEPGRYAVLAVTDTGVGMDDAVKARIFEPFFTTKEPGKGTGLGLAMVYGFVRSSGGHVGVSSEPGRGTTFEVYLPQVRERPAPAAPAAAAAVPGGAETVLVVEDDDAVRALTRHVLRAAGYAVLEASDGADALRLAEGHPGPIHLLVTDVVMPGMGGREVAERVVGRRPGTRVLYCSGYADDAVVRHGVLEAGTAFIQKPYSPALLARKVRDLLDGRP